MLKEKENNMSTLTGQKSDGSPISFNFKLGNGLPFKPMIEPEHQYFYTQDEKEMLCNISLTNDELNHIGNITTIASLKTDLENFSFFLDINDKYIVLQNVPKEIIQSKLEGKLSFQLYKKDNKKEAIIAFGTKANQ
jgi:hypothetical protein